MDKRELIQQELNNIRGSKYAKKSDVYLQKLTKQHKKVYQYTLDGELINTYNSLEECANKMAVSLSAITNGAKRKRPVVGFVFSFENDNFTLNERKDKIKPVSLLTKKGELLINAYQYEDISNYLGLEYTKQEYQKIWASVTGRTKTYRNEYIIKPLD